MQNRRQKWLMAAALAIGLGVAPHIAGAQYAAGNGHALDANSQVGSGGINGAINNGPLVSPNDIVYGNVTGGRGFTGALREADPTEFRGTLAGSGVDSFIAGSSGVPTAYSPGFDLNTPRPFYANSRGVAPPAGSVLLGGNGSGVGTDLSTGNPYAPNLGLSDLATVRVGSTNIVGVSGGTPNMLALPGSPGSADPNMAAALQGVSGITLSSSLQQSNDLILNNATTVTPNSLASNMLSEAAIEQIRQQLQGTFVAPPSAAATANPNNPDLTQNPNGPSGPNSPLNPSGLPNTSLNAGPPQPSLNPSLTGDPLGQPLTGSGLGTYRAGNKPLALASPEVYSPTYARMQVLLKRYNVQTPSVKPNAPKGTGAGATTRPAGPVLPPGAIGPANNAEPVKIDSLAAGIQVKALHDMLATGDDALKQGKYKTAIDQFTMAIRVAPNNSLFMFGRANAELAAGYYAQAEADIRRGVMTDPTALMARFDLSSMMPADRLAFITKDLQGLTSDPKASRPWLLLAYLAYSAGDANTAASDLQEAKKRSGSMDAVIRQMEKFWTLPAATSAEPKAELNK